MHKTLAAALFAILILGNAFNASSVNLARYNAGAEGAPAIAPSPADSGWVAGNPTADVGNFASAAVSPDGLTGWNAWRMLDNSTAGQFITWNHGFTPQQHLDTANNGWKLSTLIRAADPVAGNAGGNSVVLLYGNNVNLRFIAFYDITPTNTLLITLAASPNLVFTITDTNIATGYNLHEMEFSPITKRVTYRVNGTVLTTNYAGTTGKFDGVQWGTGSSGGRGDSYWNYVSFDLFDPPPPPAVVQDPQSATKAVGEAATFSAVFTNIVLGYQWYHDGSPIPGASASSYTIPFVITADAGDYVCRATNNTGFADTAPGTLTVLPEAEAPHVVSAVASVFASRVRVQFSEPVDPDSAQMAFNYGIAEGSFSVDSAQLVDRFTVDVHVSPDFAPGSNYTLLVSYILDTAGNESAPNVPTPFTAPDGFPVLEQLVAAFDGSSAVPDATDGVTWRDRSGNENHALSYSTSPNTRPTLRTNGLNGHNTLRAASKIKQEVAVRTLNFLPKAEEPDE